MRLQHTFTAAAATALFALAAPAQALTTTGVACDGNGTGMTSLSGYVTCAGAFEGNNMNQDVEGWLSTNWSLDNLIATSISGDAGSSGTLNFDTQMGSFVLALKAGNAFSLYQFDASTVAGGISSISFDTLGVGFTSNGGQTQFGQDLSHATIYAPIPEPETYALLLAGLVAVGAWSRRRKA